LKEKQVNPLKLSFLLAIVFLAGQAVLAQDNPYHSLLQNGLYRTDNLTKKGAFSPDFKSSRGSGDISTLIDPAPAKLGFGSGNEQIAALLGTEFAKECDIGQGYNFKQDEHHTFGYITMLAIGDNNIAPDIKVVDPTALTKPKATGTANTADTSGIFTVPVVSVLSNVTWSTLPNENIVLQSRISVANGQQLKMLLMQSLKKVNVTVSFVIYEYDLVNQTYFTSFKSYQGTAPAGVVIPAPNTGSIKDMSAQIYALLGKTSGTEFGLKIGSKVEEEPLGIRNYTLELTLAPPIASGPQKLQIQTSSTVKLIQPWGLPQK
jgi:hypothetical protein